MTVSRIGTVKGGSAATSNTFVATTDAATLTGDLIVVTFANATKSSGGIATPPDGTWTMLDTYKNFGASGHIEVWSKVATAAGAQSFTFTMATSAAHVRFTTTLRGQATSSPLELLGYTPNTTATTLNTATFSTTQANEYLLRMLGGNVTPAGTVETGSGLTWGSPITKISDQQGSSGSGSVFGSIAEEVGPSSAGSVGSRTVTIPATPVGTALVAIGVKAAPTGAPTNTVAPAVTGTAAVGSTLTSDNGTWDQVVTATYQWQRDGVDIAGSTGSTYLVTSADAGHALRCVVTATNSNGTGTANSNAVSVPATPVNTVAPAITPAGPYATGQTVTSDTGTWTGTGITYAYQWYRGTSPISGETASTYLLVVSDEGANISCRVTATNGGGSATANSNTIVPAVTAPISDASFLTYLSGGAGNLDPAASIGGARGGIYSGTLNGLIGPIPGSVAQAGGVFYRVVYIRNSHTTATAAGLKLYVESQFDNPGVQVAVAVPAEGVNTTVAALASGTTAPTGVTWVTATDPASGAAFGDLGPGAYRGCYVRLTVTAGTAQTAETDATFAVQGSAA